MTLVPQGGNDKVYTPDDVALDIVKHFLPQINKKKTICEPCYGKGAFLRAFKKCNLTKVTKLELDKGQDFLEWKGKVDWIITNPPWSKARDFWTQAYKTSDNVIFLITINHLIALKRRLRDMKKAGFGIKEIYCIDTPPDPWPQSGFQLGAIHVKKGWRGHIKFTGLK